MSSIDKQVLTIENNIKELGKTGVFGDTYWRASYTPQDKAGAEFLEALMKDGGMSTRFDEVGNLYGCIKGRSEKVILTGSHRDTVKDGGLYDGALGIVTAVEAVSRLYEELGTPEKTVEVIAMCEEEARFLTGFLGSRAVTGQIHKANLDETDEQGISALQAITQAGYYKGRLPEPRTDVERFIELHIEQGASLESSGKDVGIVRSIVGLHAGNITFRGQQNHAGTTPMHIRRDPVIAAAKFMTEMTEWVRQTDSTAVCTFGDIKTLPGKSNIIPGIVTITYDVRCGSQDFLNKAEMWMTEYSRSLNDGLSMEIECACKDRPAIMDDKGLQILQSIAAEKNMPYMVMASGAAHDSQIISEMVPTNMIFVPSQGGVSHSPLEYTSKEDFTNGYILLKEYLRKVAWE